MPSRQDDVDRVRDRLGHGLPVRGWRDLVVEPADHEHGVSQPAQGRGSWAGTSASARRPGRSRSRARRRSSGTPPGGAPRSAARRDPRGASRAWWPRAPRRRGPRTAGPGRPGVRPPPARTPPSGAPDPARPARRMSLGQRGELLRVVEGGEDHHRGRGGGERGGLPVRGESAQRRRLQRGQRAFELGSTSPKIGSSTPRRSG